MFKQSKPDPIMIKIQTYRGCEAGWVTVGYRSIQTGYALFHSLEAIQPQFNHRWVIA